MDKTSRSIRVDRLMREAYEDARDFDWNLTLDDVLPGVRRGTRGRARRRVGFVLVAALIILVFFVPLPNLNLFNRLTAGSPPTSTAGAQTFLATANGVVWSLSSQGVLRSPNDGRTWSVVLAAATSATAASYFLGPEDAWVVNQSQTGAMNVYRTSDGGQHWHQSAQLEGTSSNLLFDQLYFADPEHGWLLGVGENFQAGNTVVLSRLWWRTTDGGRTWNELFWENLPFQGLGSFGYATAPCPAFSPPHLAFMNTKVGWFTEGACNQGVAHPVVWTTRNGGLSWAPAQLPAPASGWGRWDVLDHGGADVGAPYVLKSAGITAILVPVAVGTSRLVVERSSDLGRTWHIAGSVDTRALPIQSTPADWFYPIDNLDWVVAAPGGLIETTTGGRTWSLIRSPIAPSGQAVSFISPEDGFLQGAGFAAAMSTEDGGYSWVSKSGPVSGYEQTAFTMTQTPGPHLAVVAGQAGLMTSNDGGRNWVERLGTSFPVTQLDFVNSTLGFAIANGELLETTDGGDSWKALLHPVSGGVSEVDFWSHSDGVATVGMSLYVTSDAGETWRQLRLGHGWTVSSNGYFPVCFSTSGVGWAMATRAGREAVLVSTSGDDGWKVALAPTAFPIDVTTHEPATTSIAGCQDRAVWLLVTQTAGPMDMQGIPQTFDLLRSLDLGRSWLDVLRSPSEVTVNRPKVPTAFDGPQKAPFEPGPVILSLASPTAVWFTVNDEDLGAVTFGSTNNGGLRWTIRTFEEPQGNQRTKWPFAFPSTWLTTTARNAEDALALFSSPKGGGSSYLYATRNGGTSWSRVAVFGYRSDR